MNAEDKKEVSWEVLPWNSEDDVPYCIWVNRKYKIKVDGTAIISLSGIGDCSEYAELRTVEEIDELIERLKEAREYAISGLQWQEEPQERGPQKKFRLQADFTFYALDIDEAASHLGDLDIIGSLEIKEAE